jgi:hypothetical protein
MNISIRQIFDSRIELESADGSPIAGYRFDRELPKPCFYPLHTAAGRQIGGFQMSDHTWHRGLWFTIKFINKSNFWEESQPFGVQRTQTQPKCEFISPQAVTISHNLRWTSKATDAVIDEDRTISFTVQDDGIRAIDWRTSLLPLQDLLLDRTPYTTWGGYSGLAFRAGREVHNTSYLLPDGQTANAIIGQPHPWALLRGCVDGDADAKISLGIIDHPGNPRSPQPWYAKSGQSYDFMNAAFLFHEPLSVSRGQRLDFRYRILYRDGWWEASEFAELADEFKHSTP